MDNTELARRLKKNDENALAEIIDKFTPLVSTIIYNISNGSLSKDDIEEAAADTFTALWYHREQIQEDKLKGFLCCIAKNKAKDKLRKSKSNLLISLDDVMIEDELVVSEEIEEKTIHTFLYQALEEIGEPDKEIIIRHYYYYQSAKVISDKMSMNHETVKSKIQRARTKLKKLLTERGF